MPSKRLSFQPHHAGFFASTVLTSGSRVLSTYAPVPFALRAVIISSLFLKSSGFMHLFFSHHALFMMKMVTRCSSSIGFGPSVTNSTVWSSILRGLPEARA